MGGIKNKNFLEVLHHLDGIHALLNSVETEGELEAKVYKVCLLLYKLWISGLGL